ncbi:MAG: polyhydroxyalkanoate synthesis regulator DNA-binding domain-containing protein [Anaerolineales bacterium]|nr:MAG: polyhydroxyalkanoate synthesis regulator DNA-binding domain-containing protein [Anaerolineales bacterium]
MRLIKRYPNRKLYDTQTKRYITLRGVADLIREDQDIHIIDNSTGDDITTLTLTQIILEYEKEIGEIAPRSLLAEIVQFGSAKLLLKDSSHPPGAYHFIDDYVIRILERLNLPTISDIQRLEEQLEELALKINALNDTDRTN